MLAKHLVRVYKLNYMTDVMRDHYFGDPTNPTVEYFTPYGTTFHTMKPHIWILERMGLFVHGYEYDKKILNIGDPNILPGTIDAIQHKVEDDIDNRDVRGIYGASLGAFIGFNILRRTTIDRMILNTGCVSALETLWEQPLLAQEKQAYVDAGYTKSDIAQHWHDIDGDTEFPRGKKVILMASTDDNLFSFKEANKYFTTWAPECEQAELITSRHLSHRSAVIRNLCRVSKTAEFFNVAKA